MKHTPGPWKVKPCPYCRKDCKGLMALPITKMPGAVVSKADARPIAAAPELLAAAEIAQDALKYYLEYGEFPLFPDASLVVEELTAAIKKATGK